MLVDLLIVPLQSQLSSITNILPDMKMVIIPGTSKEIAQDKKLLFGTDIEPWNNNNDLIIDIFK
jgi:hypothetical protein